MFSLSCVGQPGRDLTRTSATVYAKLGAKTEKRGQEVRDCARNEGAHQASDDKGWSCVPLSQASPPFSASAMSPLRHPISLQFSAGPHLQLRPSSPVLASAARLCKSSP